MRRATPSPELDFNDPWCRARWAYRLVLTAWFVSIAFYFGPNRIIFGRWWPLTTADYVPIVQERCAPVVKAMLAYQRDTGRRPASGQVLVPKYLPHLDRNVDIENGEFTFGVPRQHYSYIRYNFNRRGEGWWVSGDWVNGYVPAPIMYTYSPGTTRPADR